MPRITRDQMFMKIAEVMSERSTCYRQNVGAIITHKYRIVSSGYNGKPPGEPHCEGEKCQFTPTGGCARAVHAEQNAITYAQLWNCKEGPVVMYITLSPCVECSKLIISTKKITRVVYRQEYRLRDGIDLLLSNNIEVFRLTAAGHLIDAKTHELINS